MDLNGLRTFVWTFDQNNQREMINILKYHEMKWSKIASWYLKQLNGLSEYLFLFIYTGACSVIGNGVPQVASRKLITKNC